MAPTRFPKRPPATKAKEQTLRQWVLDYFAEANSEQVVRRYELARVIYNYDMNLHERKWWVKLWRKVQRYYAKSAQAPLAKEEK